MHVRLDGSVRRFDSGRTLVGGAPFRVTRLSDAGAVALDDLLAGCDDERSGLAQLRERLLATGVLVPEPREDDSDVPGLRDCTVVVPAFDAVGQLAACLHAIRRHLGDVEMVVVDDGSEDGPAHAAAATSHGAHIIRRSLNGGPAAARNTGLQRCDTAFVLFIDVDVELVADPRRLLRDYFDDPNVALASARVVGDGGSGALGTYERRRFPLDLGSSPGRVAADARISYVPAAIMLCRVEALRSVGGFDESLRYGEDVDLVWRIGDAGHRCWYDGRLAARHPVRRTLRERARQRFGYGTSAAPLAVRHGDRVSPWRGSRWSLALVGLAVTGHRFLAGGVIVGNAVALDRKLADRGVPPQESCRLVAQGHLAAAESLARAAVRPWWPATLAALAMIGRSPTRRRVVVAIVAPAVLAWWRSDRSIDPIRWTVAWMADDVAYSCGVWFGWWAHRTDRGVGSALTPVLVEWPGGTRVGPAETQN